MRSEILEQMRHNVHEIVWAGVSSLIGVYSENHVNVLVSADGPGKNLTVNFKEVYLGSP
jgi:hypothetical protein